MRRVPRPQPVETGPARTGARKAFTVGNAFVRHSVSDGFMNEKQPRLRSHDPSLCHRKSPRRPRDSVTPRSGLPGPAGAGGSRCPTRRETHSHARLGYNRRARKAVGDSLRRTSGESVAKSESSRPRRDASMPREPGTGRATNEPVGRTQVTWPGEGTEAPGPGEEAQGHPQLGLEERHEPRVPWATLPRNPRIEGASPPKPQETEGIQAPRRGQCEKQIHVTELCRGHWAFV